MQALERQHEQYEKEIQKAETLAERQRKRFESAKQLFGKLTLEELKATDDGEANKQCFEVQIKLVKDQFDKYMAYEKEVATKVEQLQTLERDMEAKSAEIEQQERAREQFAQPKGVKRVGIQGLKKRT